MLVAQEHGSGSQWAIQLGVARSTAIDSSLNGQVGPSAELHWILPLSARQDFQIRTGFTAITGKRIPASFFAASPTPGFPPVYLGVGLEQSKVSTQFVGVDYRVRFFHGDSTPYFVIGFLGANSDYSQTIEFQGQSQKQSEKGFKTGVSWGFGYRIGSRFGVDLRGHGFGSADNLSSFVLGFTYKL
jgi:hypothetical protein